MSLRLRNTWIFSQRAWETSRYSSLQKRRSFWRDPHFWTRLMRKLKISKLIMTSFARRSQLIKNFRWLNILKLEWWFPAEFSASQWTTSRLMGSCHTQICSTIRDQGKPLGTTTRTRKDSSSRLVMISPEENKCTIHMERNVILDFSWTTDLSI